MIRLDIGLTFPGTAEKAFKFYSSIFGEKGAGCGWKHKLAIQCPQTLLALLSGSLVCIFQLEGITLSAPAFLVPRTSS
jgi:hypothetical protein